MTIIRADIETILVNRASALMAFVGMAVTTDGENADLNDPIGYAIRQLEGTVTSIVNVSDTDVATVSESQIDALLDVAELRLLQNVYGNLDEVDVKAGALSENFSDLRTGLEKRIETLKAKVYDEHGIGGTEATVGVISLDFADHNETLTDG